MSETLVRVENVSKKFCRDLKKSLWYGLKDLGGELLPKRNDKDRELRPEEFWAVNDVSFELKRGECLGLIGRNGAGKTTLLRMLNGLIKPDKGRIEMRGRAGALIALGAGFNPILTGRENIYVNAAILGLSKKETDKKYEEIVDFAELWEFINAPVQSYSSGMQVRLGFAVAAVLIQPEVLLLDEVLAVGDLSFKQKCMHVTEKMLDKSAAIFVSHSMMNIARIASHVMVLSDGRSIYFSKDVLSGINQYFSGIGDARATCFQDTGVEFIDMRIGSPAPSKTELNTSYQIIAFGEPLTIELKMAVTKRYQGLTASIAFYDREMRPAAEVYSGNSNFKIINNKGIIRIEILIHEILFNPGVYSLDLAVWAEHLHLILKYKSVRQIQVVGSNMRVGINQIKARWVQHE